MTKTKIYGNEKTNLKLTAAAEYVRNQTDPLDIMEHIEEDGTIWYSVREDYTDGFYGCYTADEINEHIEELMDEAEFVLNADEPEHYGADAENGMVLTFSEIKRLAKEWDVPIDLIMADMEAK